MSFRRLPEEASCTAPSCAELGRNWSPHAIWCKTSGRLPSADPNAGTAGDGGAPKRHCDRKQREENQKKSPVYEGLTSAQTNRIRAALASALPSDLGGEIDEAGVRKRNGEFVVPVRTKEYPTSMVDFMQALAIAEIGLRDSGLKVRLIPDVRQRMIVVATIDGQPFAYRSSDGEEYRDLANLIGQDEKSVAHAGIVGFAYDSEDDFKLALEEAKSQFPAVDFSKVQFA